MAFSAAKTPMFFSAFSFLSKAAVAFASSSAWALAFSAKILWRSDNYSSTNFSAALFCTGFWLYDTESAISESFFFSSASLISNSASCYFRLLILSLSGASKASI